MFARYENTPITFTVTCEDKDGNLVEPAVLAYKILDQSTKTEIVSGTISGPSSVQEITLSAEDNILVSQSKPKERRLLIVTADGITPGKAMFDVINLRSLNSGA
ncbi:MAG TPA: hypothetical protein PLF11_09665 [Bacillota bacterium]|nr:hypothetical protein [Bacillota bacterium]HPV30900.1 hypothetical protein [Deltaproteobacteria bacterium]